MNYLKIEKEPGVPEHLGVAKILRAPFVRLSQHVMPPKLWADLVKKYDPELTLEFCYGTVTYQRGKNGEVEKACFWYDTSD